MIFYGNFLSLFDYLMISQSKSRSRSVITAEYIREFTQRQEYNYDYVNSRIKLQARHYFTGIPFKSYRNPFYITVEQHITVIAI